MTSIRNLCVFSFSIKTLSSVSVSQSLKLAQCSTGFPLSLLYISFARVFRYLLYCSLYIIFYCYCWWCCCCCLFFANQITKPFFLFLLLSNDSSSSSSSSTSIFTLTLLSTPCGVHTYMYICDHIEYIHYDYIYTNSSFFCVQNILSTRRQEQKYTRKYQ